MTGREIIVYILQNNLENAEFEQEQEDSIVISEESLAALLGVGIHTIRALHKLGVIK